MPARGKRSRRDVEKNYPARQFAAKLRRLADCLEEDRTFRIQVAGQRISIPSHATISIEHERGPGLHHVGYRVNSLERSREQLGAKGIGLKDPFVAPTGWKIAYLDLKDNALAPFRGSHHGDHLVERDRDR